MQTDLIYFYQSLELRLHFRNLEFKLKNNYAVWNKIYYSFSAEIQLSFKLHVTRQNWTKITTIANYYNNEQKHMITGRWQGIVYRVNL